MAFENWCDGIHLNNNNLGDGEQLVFPLSFNRIQTIPNCQLIFALVIKSHMLHVCALV